MLHCKVQGSSCSLPSLGLRELSCASALLVCRERALLAAAPLSSVFLEASYLLRVLGVTHKYSQAPCRVTVPLGM
jgi:hypothetical protein